MGQSKKLLFGGILCGVLVVVLGGVGGAIWGDAEGGMANVAHYTQMFLLFGTVVLLVASAVLAVRGKGRRGTA